MNAYKAAKVITEAYRDERYGFIVAALLAGLNNLMLGEIINTLLYMRTEGHELPEWTEVLLGALPGADPDAVGEEALISIIAKAMEGRDE